MNESRELTRYFCGKLDIKVTKGQFMKYMNICKELLTMWSLEEIESVIDYISRHPLKSPIYSPGYLSYVMKDILALVAKEKARELIDVVIDTPQSNVDLKELNSNKYNNSNVLIRKDKLSKF